MNPELAKKWVNALESGDYSQAKGALKQAVNGKDCFCCLGVLMDISGKPIIPNQQLPTGEQQLELGLSRNAVQLLSSLNDNGITFNKIAVAIKYHYWHGEKISL